MSKVKVYHNPRCGKSRNSLKLVQEKVGEDEIEIIKYLETPPTVAELESILGKLGLKPEELVRKNEKIWKEEFKGKTFSDKELMKIMVEHPILIERPVVVNGEKAVVGRPPENVLEIL